jgi:hypothetical protein
MPARRYIHTHPSFGYRFQPEPAAVSHDFDNALDGAPHTPHDAKRPIMG